MNLVDSDDSEAECIKCPICLASLVKQEVATPESCEHYFCAKCLMEWAKVTSFQSNNLLKINYIFN